jgi:hypothetical protein
MDKYNKKNNNKYNPYNNVIINKFNKINDQPPKISLKEKYQNHWFILNSNTITKIGTAIISGISVIYLTALSVINKDLKYPEEHPYLFTIETLLFSVGAGLIIFLMAYGRGILGFETIIHFIINSLRFGLIQLLFQFSGFYTWVFS